MLKQVQHDSGADFTQSALKSSRSSHKVTQLGCEFKIVWRVKYPTPQPAPLIA